MNRKKMRQVSEFMFVCFLFEPPKTNPVYEILEDAMPSEVPDPCAQACELVLAEMDRLQQVACL